jgi:PEP-CTERM motif-containing protein
MRLAPGRILLLAACLFVVSAFGWAEVITFNSLPGNGTPIPNGFAGMDWNNFYDMSTLKTAAEQVDNVPPVSNAGLVFAYNNGAGPASFSSPDAFTFTSAMLSTDGTKSMVIEVLGLLNGSVVDRLNLALDSAVPVQENFDWSGIDGVQFIVPQPGTGENRTIQFALDQVVINTPAVPEPATLLLLGSGLGLVYTQARRLRGKK